MNSISTISSRDRILGALWGSIVGDALGVPVEFRNRAEIQSDPVTGMRGFGSHRQPKGTWSDDSALILCTIDSLLRCEFDTGDMGRSFVRWMDESLWTATGVVFDIGLTTTDSLKRIVNGTPAEEAGGRDQHSNGNGSLMRIIPICLRFSGEPLLTFSHRIERASGITHGHERSKMACVLFGLLIRQILRNLQPDAALAEGREEFRSLYENTQEFALFSHHMVDDFSTIPESEIDSTGYVLHTLCASIWCLINSTDYRECVLKAVNLGGDTDTTGCVAGGLAGLTCGVQSIPSGWIDQLPRKSELDHLFHKFVDLTLSSEAKGAKTR